MPEPNLRFGEVYVVSSPPGDYQGADLALGMRKVEGRLNPLTKKPDKTIEWLSAQETGMGGHILFWEMVEQEGPVVTLRDVGIDREGMTPDQYVLRFEPLTDELWRKLIDGGFMQVSDSVARLKSANDVKNVFISDLLEDWWVENPKDVF
jgi:hypothetical protein